MTDSASTVVDAIGAVNKEDNAQISKEEKRLSNGEVSTESPTVNGSADQIQDSKLKVNNAVEVEKGCDSLKSVNNVSSSNVSNNCDSNDNKDVGKVVVEKSDPKVHESTSEAETSNKNIDVDEKLSGDGVSSAKSEGEKEQETPKKKGKKKKTAEEEGPPKEMRRSSRQRKPVSYVDDVKITARDDDVIPTSSSKCSSAANNSDVEMIEETDPLAINDNDRRKAQQTKPQQNIIVIDTNTLLRNQGNVAAAVAQHQRNSMAQQQQASSSSVTQNGGAFLTQQQQQQLLQVAAQNVSGSGGTLNIGGINLSAAAVANNPAALQNAIAAITGGANAPPGLKNAYITAVQQAMVQQQAGVNTTPAGQQYLANLQQYYNTLGALRDEAYVIEAPSFIVPYVMEGKPKESIKDFLKRIEKEQEEHDKKEKEGKSKKSEEKGEKEKTDEKADKVKAAKEKTENKEKVDKEKSEEKPVQASEERSEEIETVKKETSEENEKVVKMEVEESLEKSSESTEKEEKTEEKKNSDDASSKVKEAEDAEHNEKKDGDGKKGDEARDDNDDKSDEDKENIDKESSKEKKMSPPEEEEEFNYEKHKNEDYTHLGRWEGYYKSSLGSFVLDLGLSLVQEFIQADLLRMQKRKLDKLKSNPTRQDIAAVKALDRQLSKSRDKNAHLKMPLHTCRFCNFRTDSFLVMDRHLESPHMVNYTYKCNFCPFETRGPQVILFHMEAEHAVRGRLERAPAFFQCQLCPFEDNNKSKMTRHSFSCAKKFRIEKNCEMLEWEPPAKIPKQLTRARPLPVGTNIKNIGGNLYDASGRTLLPKGLPQGLTMQQLQAAVAQGLLPNPSAANASNNAAMNLNRGRGRPVGTYKPPLSNQVGTQQRPIASAGSNKPSNAGTQQPLSQSQQLALAGQLFQGIQGNKSLKPGQSPSISITALPRAPSGQAGTAKTNAGKDGKPSFVICEICDGYIKDLEQLRTHMNFIHKVKIHPKMIYNRPPLNCQKCQHRFFTDQGLERHLLGSHGLVTSSMQEAANKSKDAGRCPICGKVFQWKLLNHVARDHKMTLKPAHLSYKCTVCTATFNMYRLFESHVYSAHSVIKQQKDGVSSTISSKTANGSSEAPLRINDEITIIPQPSALKSSVSVTSNRSTIEKKLGVPNVSKEITITKVGAAPTSSRGSSNGGQKLGTIIKAGSSVEVISLDESPAKRDAAAVVAAALAASKRANSSPADAASASKRLKTS